MASVSMRGRGNPDEIAELLRREILNSGVSCELVDSVRHSAGGQSVTVMVFEKYYYRASNRASLTVVVGSDGGDVTVDAIGSGGGQGVVFKFSWGTEQSFADTVVRILAPLGFQ